MKILRTDPDRFGIRARLLTLLLPGILGLLVLDSWIDHQALRHEIQDAYDQAMLASAQALRSSLFVSSAGTIQLNAPLQMQAAPGSSAPTHRYLHVVLVPLAGTAPKSTSLPQTLNLLGEADLPPPPALAELPRPADDTPTWYDAQYRGVPVRLVALRGLLVDGQGQSYQVLIQAAESAVPRDLAHAASSEQALVRDARMLLLVVVLVWLGVVWSLRPLERLRASVLKSKGQDLQPLDTSEVPHEVAPLVEAINQHVSDYQQLLAQQSQFLADASHQLRTPLAILLTQAGFALRENEPEQLHDVLRAMVTQIERSRRLCDQLLALAHAAEHGTSHELPGLVDLSAVAKEVVLQYLTPAHERGQDLGWVQADADATTDSPLVVPVQAKASELHEALANLIHNAIVHTPSGGHITVTVSAHNGVARVQVCDDGPGIAPERRAEVFERFRQLDKRTGEPSRGSGLGLPIARAYARRNGGEIDLDGVQGTRSSPTGLCATLRLPLAFGIPP
jgi:two-component system sensor histidine kinase TctE